MSARGAVKAVPVSCSAYSPYGAALRRIAADRQRAGQRLGGELVAEARLVVGSPSPLMTSSSTPRRIWSRSIDSNSALKLPSPKPSSPLRWMNSKNTGPSSVSEKICSSRRGLPPSVAAVEQDAARLQLGDRLAVAGQALVEHLVVDVVGRRHQRHAGQRQLVDGGEQVVGEQRDVLDALAVELHQELLDLARALATIPRSAGCGSCRRARSSPCEVRPVYSPWMSK